MKIVNAELVKVNYNTFITMKINFANNLMEICHKMRNSGADVDVVYDALKDCTRRIISPMLCEEECQTVADVILEIILH